jgi:hypothetical protein
LFLLFAVCSVGYSKESILKMMREDVDSRSGSPLPKAKSSSSSVEKTSNDLFKIFKNFDIYQKIDESFRIQTTTGAVMSLIGWVVISILVLAEFRNFMTPKYNEMMVVDTRLGEQLKVNINITFHALTCNEVSSFMSGFPFSFLLR